MKKDPPKREVPKFDELMNPTLQALKRLGGSASIEDGAPPIDLIDGRLLAEKLKELKLGIRTNLIEHVEVIEDWFGSI